jgi:predicted RND superfamily exporter protein
MVLGLMGLLGLPVNLATVLIAGVAVGLAVDDTIHLVHSYQAHRRSGKDRSSACSAALLEVGIRIVMTSVILIGAFASMGFSNFLPTSQFGILSSLTIALALAADMLLLPVLLAGRRAAVRKAFPIPELTKCAVARRVLSRLSTGASQ